MGEYVINGLDIKAARRATGMSIEILSKTTGVAKSTIVRIESGEDAGLPILRAIKRALELKGVTFNTDGSIVFLPSTEHNGS